MAVTTRSVATLLRDHARWCHQVTETLKAWGFDSIADAADFVRAEGDIAADDRRRELVRQLNLAGMDGWRVPRREAA